MDRKKLAESYRKAVDQISKNNSITLQKRKVIEFEYPKGTHRTSIFEAGFVVPNIDDTLLTKWVKINYMVNMELVEHKEKMNTELKKVGL